MSGEHVMMSHYQEVGHAEEVCPSLHACPELMHPVLMYSECGLLVCHGIGMHTALHPYIQFPNIVIMSLLGTL